METHRSDRSGPRVFSGESFRDDARDRSRWYLRNKFDLMARFLDDESALDAPRAELEERIARATRSAKRVLRMRLVVTILLAFGVVATAASALASVVWVPDPFDPGVQATIDLLGRVAAIAGSASVVLLAARLAFDRYLDLVDTTVTFLGMLLVTLRARKLKA